MKLRKTNHNVEIHNSKRIWFFSSSISTRIFVVVVVVVVLFGIGVFCSVLFCVIGRHIAKVECNHERAHSIKCSFSLLFIVFSLSICTFSLRIMYLILLWFVSFCFTCCADFVDGDFLWLLVFCTSSLL